MGKTKKRYDDARVDRVGYIASEWDNQQQTSDIGETRDAKATSKIAIC